MPDALTLLVAGDCGPTHGPTEGYTELIRPVLAKADMRFVNCMRAYSTRGQQAAHAPQVCQPPAMAAIFTSGLFDGINLANNHSCDAGPDAMLDTRALFNTSGIQVTGAGQDLAEARKPAIVERNGVKVGYLGYTSVGRAEDAAGANKPGIARIRVETTYETRGAHESVRIRTEPNPQDLAMLVEDVRALRKQVDVVILAFHAGVLRLPRVISDYQVAVAHAAIDAGADLVVGHAPHIPKAIEMYKGKAVFYSLGVFAMTKSFPAPSWTERAWMHGAVRNHTDLDPNYPLMPYGKPSTLSLLAKIRFSKEGILRVSFLPMAFDNQYRPEVIPQSDKRFDEIFQYMEWTSEDMPHRFNVEDGEVFVS